MSAILANTTASRSRPLTGWSQTKAAVNELLASHPGLAWHQVHQLDNRFSTNNVSGDEGYWQSGFYVEHVATGCGS